MRHLKNWLRTYLEYTDKQESPEGFHLWSGISVIGSTLGRRTFIDRGYYVTYPNQYIVLVSGSARCKKSTAAEIATKVYNTAVGGINGEALSKKITVEKLIRNMAITAKKTGTSACFLFSSELSTLLGRRTTNYELMDVITDIYGCPKEWLYETKTQGTDTMKNVCLNILGCTTPEHLAGLPPDMVEGGLSGRTIFVVKDKPRPPIHDPKIHMTSAREAQFDDLVHDLQEIHKVSGEFTFSPAADLEYKRLYHELHKAKRTADNRLDPYFGRKGEHILKLAMVVSVSYSDKLILEATDIISAENFLSNLESTMTGALAGASMSRASKYLDRVREQIENTPKGRLDRSSWLKMNYYRMGKNDFEEVLDTLIESEVIRSEREGRKQWYVLN